MNGKRTSPYLFSCIGIFKYQKIGVIENGTNKGKNDKAIYFRDTEEL